MLEAYLWHETAQLRGDNLSPGSTLPPELVHALCIHWENFCTIDVNVPFSNCLTYSLRQDVLLKRPKISGSINPESCLLARSTEVK